MTGPRNVRLDKVSRRVRLLRVLSHGGISYSGIIARMGKSASETITELNAARLIHRIDGEYFLTDAGQQARKAQDAHAG